MKYYIYTDGATSNNGRANAKGGWAAIFIKNEANQEYEIRSGGEMLLQTKEWNLLELLRD